jgi:hypothetical protein
MPRVPSDTAPKVARTLFEDMAVGDVHAADSAARWSRRTTPVHPAHQQHQPLQQHVRDGPGIRVPLVLASPRSSSASVADTSENAVEPQLGLHLHAEAGFRRRHAMG